MEIDWIRHGEVPGNRERRYVGRTDEALTPQGEEAARKMQRSLPQPDLVFVSPLRRCRQTARLLYPALEPIVVAEMTECDFGRFEYQNARDLSGDPTYQAWIDSGGTLPFPGGEDRRTFQKRVLAGYERARTRMEREKKEYAVFVVHGGVIMAVMDALSEPHRDYFAWQCGSLDRLRTETVGGTLRLREWIRPPAE